MSYYVEVQETDNGDLFIELPEEIIETLGWEQDDLLTWDLKGSGFVLKKLNDDSGFEPLEL